MTDHVLRKRLRQHLGSGMYPNEALEQAIVLLSCDVPGLTVTLCGEQFPAEAVVGAFELEEFVAARLASRDN